MKDLGRVLRERREQLGISLDELQTKTKIRKRYLMALEEGNWDLLPGAVYARGFVKSYAEALGLDGKQLLEQYVDANGSGAIDVEPPVSTDATPDRPEPAVEPPRSAPVIPPQADTPPSRRSAPTRTSSVRPSRPSSRRRTRQGRNVAGETAAVVAILAVIGAAWWLIGLPGKDKQPHNNAIAGQTENGTNAVANNPVVNNTDNSADGTGAPDNQAGTDAAKPAVQIKSQDYRNHEQTFVVSANGPLHVELATANAPCWIQAYVDGKNVVPSDTVPASAKRSWTVKQQLRVKVGNVPAVNLTVDGQPLALPPTNEPIWVTISKE
jgi:cytoskeleton protein RodZ